MNPTKQGLKPSAVMTDNPGLKVVLAHESNKTRIETTLDMDERLAPAEGLSP